MALNPMQRKARISFLLGIIITLLITGAVIVLLFLQLKKLNDEKAAEAALKVNVYTLNQDVKSGEVITEDMLSKQAVNKTLIPSNATSDYLDIESWFLQTKDGEQVYRDKEGLYLKKADSIIELILEDGQYYKIVDGEKEKVNIRNNVPSDDDGYFTSDQNNEDQITRIYEEVTGKYYVYKLDTTNQENVTRTKVYLELNTVPIVAKIDMNANTVITSDLIVQSDEVVTDDVRRVQYNTVLLPMDLMTDDYIDIRIMFPNGQNFIVVSKALVEIPMNSDGSYAPDSIFVNLREDEILALSSAVVEAYGVQGASLYATKYAEPGLQKAAIPTYTPNYETTQLIRSNPNIVKQAEEELAARYKKENADLRNQFIQSMIDKDTSYTTNIPTGLDQDASNTQEIRRKYLETLLQE